MIKVACILRIFSKCMELTLMLLTWEKQPMCQFGTAVSDWVLFIFSGFVRMLKLSDLPLNASPGVPLYKDCTIRGTLSCLKDCLPWLFIIFWSYVWNTFHLICFFWSTRWHSNWIKVTKIMFQLRDNESVCVLLIRLVTMKETCNHLFLFVCFSGFWRGGEESKRVWGISEGVRHASNKDGFYIVHFNQAEQCRSLKAWSGGRSGRQSFVSLVAPSLLITRFHFVRFFTPYSPSHTWKELCCCFCIAYR